MNTTQPEANGNLQDSSHGAIPMRPPRDEAKYQAAREQGWSEPVPYDYSTATPAPGNDGESSGNASVWGFKSQVYEFDQDFGDVGPEVPELEKELFHGEFQMRRGIRFDKLCSVKVVTETTSRPDPIRSFRDAGLHPIVLENVQKCGYDVPTPIQAYTIPAVMAHRDVIAIAQTGSGKTGAFMIPIVAGLMGKAKKLAAARPNVAKGWNPHTDRVRAEPLVLVVCPTRELCCQIFDEARRLCYRSMLRPACIYGGGPIREQKEELMKGCDILIATPGRLKDFMSDPGFLILSRLRYTVIDEADEMLHEDWEEEMSAVMSGADANMDAQHQYLLFSATFDKNMRKIAKKFLSQDHVRIRIGRAGSVHTNIKQQIVYVEKDMKRQALYDLLIATPPARTLVFVRSKKTADFVDDYLYNNGFPSTSIHSDRTQREREDALRAFRSGKAPILVATGVSARGLDVRNVMHVINFDLPSIDHNGQDEYIHRIGRTARIGNEGLATSFYNDMDEPMGPFLAKILTESGNPVPDFLEQYKPDDANNIDFDDDSGVEENDELTAGDTNGSGDTGDGWGSAPNAPQAVGQATADAWGSAPVAQKTPGQDNAENDGGNAKGRDEWGNKHRDNEAFANW